MLRPILIVVVLLAGSDALAQSKGQPVSPTAPGKASSPVHADAAKETVPLKAAPPVPAKPAAANPHADPVKITVPPKAAPPAPVKPADVDSHAAPVKGADAAGKAVPAETAAAVAHPAPAPMAPAAVAKVAAAPTAAPLSEVARARATEDTASLIRVAKAVNAAVVRRRSAVMASSPGTPARPTARRPTPAGQRYAVRWPDFEARWNVAWPATAEGFTLSWRDQTADTVVPSTEDKLPNPNSSQ